MTPAPGSGILGSAMVPNLPLAALLLWATPGLAADAAPRVERVGDGWQATLELPASPDAVRRILADARDLTLRPPDVLSVEVTPRDTCQEIRGRTRGLFRPLTYRTLRCPTATGYRESLLEVGDFKVYDAEWRIEPVEGGSCVTFRAAADPDLPVPRALVLENVKRSTVVVITALRDRLAGQR